MATKKLTPIEHKEPTTEDFILLELKKQTEYLNRIDWKQWVTMNIVKKIAEENGYTIDEIVKED